MIDCRCKVAVHMHSSYSVIPLGLFATVQKTSVSYWSFKSVTTVMDSTKFKLIKTDFTGEMKAYST